MDDRAILDDEVPDGPDGCVLIVCSSGGHLAQMMRLMPWLEGRQRSWVTFDTADAVSRLADEPVHWAHHPTTRSIPNLVRNFVDAIRLLPRLRPSVVMSNGAGVTLPYFIAAKLLRVPTVYIEVFDRLDTRTLTGRLCRPLTDLFLVQWPEQQQLYRDTVLVGRLL